MRQLLKCVFAVTHTHKKGEKRKRKKRSGRSDKTYHNLALGSKSVVKY